MLRTATLTVSLLLFATAAFADENHPEEDCANIKNIAAAGDKAYKAKQYEKARDRYMEQVGWTQSCQLPDSALATAYNNVALTWIRQGDYRKAKFWLMIDAQDKKSQYNLGLIKDKLAALPQPTSPAGEYWEYAGMGMINSFVVVPAGKGFRVNFDGVRPGLRAMYFGPNIGSLEGKTTISNHQGVVKQQGDDDYGRCSVTMNFAPEQLKTTVEGDCGFGYGVSAQGEYQRVE